MDMVFVLLPLSLLLAVIGLVGYLWALRSKQFDDLRTPSVRMLYDDEVPPSVEKRQ